MQIWENVIGIAVMEVVSPREALPPRQHITNADVRRLSRGAVLAPLAVDQERLFHEENTAELLQDLRRQSLVLLSLPLRCTSHGSAEQECL